MSKRPWLVLGLAAGAAALSGCVVVPAEPAYGYGAPAAVVRVAPPPVIVAPPYRGHPRHRHSRDRGWWGR